MKITFLGTSHGVPSEIRHCSSALIETDGVYYIIDGGAPVIDELLRNGVDINSVRAVFTTHAHGDHVDGLLQLADLVNWYYKEASIKLFMTEQRIIDAFTNLLEAIVDRPLDKARVGFSLWDTENGYADNNIKVSPIPNCHLKSQNRPSYSLLIECEGKRVLFTGDMSQELKYGDFPELPDIDLLISEMAHFSPAQVDPYLRKCTAKQMVFTHVFPFDKFNAIDNMKDKYAFPVSAAHDSDIIIL